MGLFISSSLTIPSHELEFSFSRSSGSGGQNVNKVNSKATLRWDPAATKSLTPAQAARFRARFASRITKDGTVVISSDTFRDQPRNVEECLSRLREMIRAILKPPKKRIATKPGRAAKQRRIESKKKRSKVKGLRRRNFASD